MGPCKLRELEAVMALLQVRHKEHKTYGTREDTWDGRQFNVIHNDEQWQMICRYFR